MADPEIRRHNHLRMEKTYTLNEAVELMKQRDKNPNSKPINWKCARTGKPVYIGYNG